MPESGANNLYCPVCDEVRYSTIRERSDGPSVYFEVTCEACQSVRQVHVGTVERLRAGDKKRDIQG